MILIGIAAFLFNEQKMYNLFTFRFLPKSLKVQGYIQTPGYVRKTYCSTNFFIIYVIIAPQQWLYTNAATLTLALTLNLALTLSLTLALAKTLTLTLTLTHPQLTRLASFNNMWQCKAIFG